MTWSADYHPTIRYNLANGSQTSRLFCINLLSRTICSAIQKDIAALVPGGEDFVPLAV